MHAVNALHRHSVSNRAPDARFDNAPEQIQVLRDRIVQLIEEVRTAAEIPANLRTTRSISSLFDSNRQTRQERYRDGHWEELAKWQSQYREANREDLNSQLREGRRRHRLQKICAPDAAWTERIPDSDARPAKPTTWRRTSMSATSRIDAFTARLFCWNRKPKQGRAYAARKARSTFKKTLTSSRTSRSCGRRFLKVLTRNRRPSWSTRRPSTPTSPLDRSPPRLPSRARLQGSSSSTGSSPTI
ncbi:hypothetical protein L596_004365 [Steinernema carpocapsae]|uniref:Uncharacterized protein n=1 Tax=Steinernema carpocapsae TaxID=34508 RepID=A0A4U8UVI5_STECR|nr:hypothetical protein L596_004365 [Steinernema carpocapsae]